MNVPEEDPLIGLWSSVADSPSVDQSNVWGLALTGLAIIVGASGAGRILGVDAYLEQFDIV